MSFPKISGEVSLISQIYDYQKVYGYRILWDYKAFSFVIIFFS